MEFNPIYTKYRPGHVFPIVCLLFDIVYIDALQLLNITLQSSIFAYIYSRYQQLHMHTLHIHTHIYTHGKLTISYILWLYLQTHTYKCSRTYTYTLTFTLAHAPAPTLTHLPSHLHLHTRTHTFWCSHQLWYTYLQTPDTCWHWTVRQRRVRRVLIMD